MYNCFVDGLRAQDVEYKEDVLLSSLSPISIGGRATLVVYPKTEASLVDVVRQLHSKKIKYRVVGRLSNLLPRDTDITEVIIKTDKITHYFVADEKITVSCGCFAPKIIKELARDGCSFAIGLCGIPASIGGMIYSNAGAFGCEIADTLLSARIFLPDENQIRVYSKEEMCFSYRSSILSKNGGILLGADFSLSRELPEHLLKKISEMQRIRSISQPHGERSLGSTFKRMPTVPTAKLIDSLGLKGFTVGGAQVSNKHAGFIVNRGGATFYDYLSLMNFIQKRVFDGFGVLPTPEIEIL